jgi:hypothetical protein
LRGTLHEQHDVVRLHLIVDELLNAHLLVPLGAHAAPPSLAKPSGYRPIKSLTVIYVPQTIVHPKQIGSGAGMPGPIAPRSVGVLDPAE